MNKIDNSDILAVIHRLFDGYAHDHNIIMKTVAKCYNKNLLVIEKMIGTGHYTKDSILENIINNVCETKKAVVSISPKRKRVLNFMLHSIAKDDSQIAHGETFATMYQQYLREYNDIQKEKESQKNMQQYKKVSAFIPENINKFLIEQNSHKKSGEKGHKFEGGWIPILSRLLATLKHSKKHTTVKKHKKQGKEKKS
ncbi:hypothetical protein CAXC1_220021 [Candidatus Xenohaliotis californiensis]|uniref:Uncharacterized protein n=1 Tax=Candidatus Xenohaliotis californiensis TaxID=84677 RepID=A0ABP0EVP0_9RICK|nr:hypothetical protein CAXC1_220021 [Candidatus Xenohaliotis californiensis]